MTTIKCEYCKLQVDECPDCKKPLGQHIVLPMIILIISLLAVTVAGYRWNSAFAEHEDAQTFRQAYLKKHPEAVEKLR
ncbi:MAG: hypothetical protein KKB51_04590 [Candidatus Riflebacteria bacterium]|nr:hypothetical protein [Candidatus Riflebacteria bacterium]